MTREEVIKILKELQDEYIKCRGEEEVIEVLIDSVDIEALDMAIKALEQENYKAQYERFSKKAEIVILQLREDRDRLLDVLDKIKAEMFEEMTSHIGTGVEVIQAYADGLKKGLDILDKHREENEGNINDKKKLSWLGKNCKDCGNEKCKKLGTLPKGYDCALWQPEK